MICANLDRLEIYVGGEHFATVLPDTAGYPHLDYPPSFADFGTVDGSSRPELRIDGYLGADKVASRSFSSDPVGDVLALTADDAEIDGDGADATRGEFRAVDRYGAPRPYVAGQVGFDVAGPAVLVGDNPFDFAAAGGAGAVWIRSLPGARGTVTIRASHPTLGHAVARVRVRLFRAQQAHDNEVLPAVRVEFGLPADSLAAEAAGQVAADGAGVEGQHLQLDPVQSQLAEAPGQDQPGYLTAQSLAAQRGDEQAHRVGRAVLARVDPEPGAANAVAVVFDRPPVLAGLRRPASRG
jgi:hypothetical protein